MYRVLDYYPGGEVKEHTYSMRDAPIAWEALAGAQSFIRSGVLDGCAVYINGDFQKALGIVPEITVETQQVAE